MIAQSLLTLSSTTITHYIPPLVFEEPHLGYCRSLFHLATIFWRILTKYLAKPYLHSLVSASFCAFTSLFQLLKSSILQ